MTNPSAPESTTQPRNMPLEPTATRATLHKLRIYGLWLAGAASVLLLLGAMASSLSSTEKEIRLTQALDIESQILSELAVLNDQKRVPEPLALESALALGREVGQGSPAWHLTGQLYEQKQQYFATQLIETLSRPVSGLDSEAENRIQRESAIRLEALPKLEVFVSHIQTKGSGLATLLLVLGLVPAFASLLLLGRWLYHVRTDHYRKRINSLSRAIYTQDELDMKRLGASSALEGLMSVIDNTRNAEHRRALMQIGQQLEDLKTSGHRVLGFANSFHRLSSHATNLARTALTNEHRNQKADGTIDMVKAQLDGLREDMRNAAQGLRRAGQASRQLMNNLQNPTQMELDLADPDLNSRLQTLVDQNQQALKEAIEGMVLASQKINLGQSEANKLAGHLAVNHTAWSNLLGEIEQHAENASSDSSEALQLAKDLIKSTKDQSSGALPKPIKKLGSSGESAN